ncbi:hypothetical protein KIW84_041822 [Lathyrus oleraceus]|uniref:Uncharacterized protein n=1 Tax=Pisum sativum TaxID=3888 RepID=A0A9D4X9M3_PEA|nr:hypothetical protein KIW84_041822 [Pisum sativum]
MGDSQVLSDVCWETSRWFLIGQREKRLLASVPTKSLEFSVFIEATRRISLDALRVGDFWLDKVIEVRGEISRYFMERFSDSETNRSTLDGVALPCLSVAEAKSFSVRFLFLEVNVVVVEIDESTNPDTVRKDLVPLWEEDEGAFGRCHTGGGVFFFLGLYQIRCLTSLPPPM